MAQRTLTPAGRGSKQERPPIARRGTFAARHPGRFFSVASFTRRSREVCSGSPRSGCAVLAQRWRGGRRPSCVRVMPGLARRRKAGCRGGPRHQRCSRALGTGRVSSGQWAGLRERRSSVIEFWRMHRRWRAERLAQAAVRRQRGSRTSGRSRCRRGYGPVVVRACSSRPGA